VPDEASHVISIPALPTDRDEELVRRFTVTLHYLRHLEIYLTQKYGRGQALYPGLGAALTAHRPYLKVSRRSPIDLDGVRRFVEIGWISELQLRVPAAIGSASALRYTNAWAPIHAYYSAYMLLQAWFLANGMTGLADDHTATLRSVSAQIRDRQLFPPPWSVLAAGNALGGSCSYINEPQPGACAAKIEVLSIPIGLPGAYAEAEFWARFGTWLRTTREARLRAKEDEWKKKKGRKRIDPKVRVEYARTLHPTSLFDCLWRMRIRSNYRSVEPYLVRYIGEDDAERFHRALVAVTRATLFLLESYLARVIGAAQFEALAEAFLNHDSHGMTTSTLGARLPVVLSTATHPGAGKRQRGA
jgi:hypothetical protein